jgi:hypothetical protein
MAKLSATIGLGSPLACYRTRRNAMPARPALHEAASPMREEGKTWLAYDDPKWLAERHGARVGTGQVLVVMSDALAAVAKEATMRATGETS